MEPNKMARWEPHSAAWEIRQEQLGNGYWLNCYRPIEGEGQEYHGWVYVDDKSRDTAALKALESFELKPYDPLMLECICIEMRAKYKSP
jgi:hypothetical protein